MGAEFLDALRAIAKEREITEESLLDTVEAALVTAELRPR